MSKLENQVVVVSEKILSILYVFKYILFHVYIYVYVYILLYTYIYIYLIVSLKTKSTIFWTQSLSWVGID